MKKKILLIFPLIMFSLISYGQFFYTDHSTVDSVEISYKWKEYSEEPTQLRLKFKNRNNHAVLISLDVDYYMNGILSESSTVDNFCVHRKGMVAGKLNGIIITSTELSNEELQSSDFELRINNIKIMEADECENKAEENNGSANSERH